MKKKLLSLVLVCSVLCSLAVPAMAQTADERLASVTARVKETLGLDTEPYTEFYGELAEDILAPSWYLEWYADGSSLSISATEEGKILSYYYYDEAEAGDSGAFAPRFPAGDQDSAKAAAQAFLDKVLTEAESVTMEARTVYLGATQYRFSGEILVNGLPAGLSYSISVRCEDNAITNFYRDDFNGQVMGGIPSPEAAVTREQARTALRDTLALRLEYVLPEDGGKEAVLRYLPERGDEYYVDAATGQLVNLTELAQGIEKGDTGGASSNTAATQDAAAAEPESSLSAAEQAGAEKLEGVLDKDALDGKAREISQLGLEKYTLSSVNYTVAREADENGEAAVTASLRYGRQVAGASWRRTVTVDAKTGELIRVSSSARLPDETMERGVDAAQAQEKAAAFLKSQCAGQFEKTALYDSNDALETDWRCAHSFTFAQKENGYFLPANYISVGVDATDGSISAYGVSFDDSVTFESPEGILTAGQALDAWLDTYTVQLAYIHVPAAIDYSVPEYEALRDYGISYLYKLALGYGLTREDYLLGISARTGEPVRPDWAAEQEGIVYSDVEGHWAQKEIETLARYRVGFAGGQFQPRAALAQIDLIALLASTEGYLYDGAGEDAADRLYSYAYSMGLLKEEERDDTALLARAETVRLILDAAGYGSVAKLEGIFRTGFTDDSRIPAEYHGYAALAQGLGLVTGDAAGAFNPGAQTTRAEAAVMLYRLMAR